VAPVFSQVGPTTDLGSAVTDLCWSPNGARVAAGNSGGQVLLDTPPSMDPASGYVGAVSASAAAVDAAATPTAAADRTSSAAASRPSAGEAVDEPSLSPEELADLQAMEVLAEMSAGDEDVRGNEAQEGNGDEESAAANARSEEGGGVVSLAVLDEEEEESDDDEELGGARNMGKRRKDRKSRRGADAGLMDDEAAEGDGSEGEGEGPSDGLLGGAARMR